MSLLIKLKSADLMEKKYYKSIEDFIPEEGTLTGAQKSKVSNNIRIDEAVPTSPSNRRDFLKLFGFAIASTAVLNSCEQPVRKAIPYLIKPDSVTPGKANYYASTFFDGNDYCSILVKVRDGRPIKIEGNTLSSVTKGGTSARIQASVLSLYDTVRYRNPMISAMEVEWEQADAEIVEKLNAIKEKNGTIAIVSPTIISPSTFSVIEEFKKIYPSTKHIQYDAVSGNAITIANKKVFGREVVPSYHFDKAKIIVGFGADFLGSWLMPVEYTKQYSAGRKLDEGSKEMSQHIHFEAGMSLTGSNADKRVVVKNSQQKIVLANLYNEIAKAQGEATIEVQKSPVEVAKLAEKLQKNKGKSLIVSGSNDIKSQIIVNGINYLLGNYGSTIDLDTPLLLKKGNDVEMAVLTNELNSGEVAGVIVCGVNPVYDYHNGAQFLEGLKKAELSVAIANLKDETAEECMYLCPDHYELEAWNDFEIKTGYYSLSQPAIRPLFKTRAMQESLLKWAQTETDYLDYIKSYWEKNIYPSSGFSGSFYEFWNKILHDGVFELINTINSQINFSKEAIIKSVKSSESSGIELELYESVGVGVGKQANNPWLQELPDPITKVTWDNYVCVSARLAEELQLEEEDLVKIDGSLILPVLIQPGQENKTISVALGYGRKNAGTVADGVGANGYPLVGFDGETRQYFRQSVKIEKVEGEHQFAKTQTHHSMEGRAIIRETTLAEFIENPASGNEKHEEIEKHHTTLYKEREFKGHHWGMAVDLNSCTGCNACIVACSAENNVPIVGKEQVRLAREMHWIRIDRYYSGNPENPEVVRQPVMCQHCDNAPCENVCPVGATTNSHEGINQMAYNRCIGTRYCNNNCPYKVRRFNFYDYTNADAIPHNTYDPTGMTLDLKRMVLNPDVVVRAKGVIEKCSMCIQRIQEKKLDAKLDNRMLEDGEIKPACAQGCPANAIVFGDLNNEESKISKFFKNERNYHLLEELHTLPSVGYLTKVRNLDA
jgi:molybdopterin-containing oxidoreductase family iron-sulfur binding subunit